ncbi:MAG: 6-phosphofructokinase [Bacilli bacterium]|nr:6-phosphofructokinase [Bacilli bacterium]
MRIGILTSGGDSPGMNDAIYAVVKTCYKRGIECYGIYNGYRGLVRNQIAPLSLEDVHGIESKGGTILRSARLPEFKEVEVRQKAVENLKANGIDALVVVGGDGSYMGALRLTEMGINCIGLPGTIDNDIASTDFTIGFFTCTETIQKGIELVKDTARSHSRCIVIETMGNKCGDLALFGAISCGVDAVITREHPIDEEELFARLTKKREKNPDAYAIVVISEKNPDCQLNDLVEKIKQNTPFGQHVRGTSLGFVQRGGNPCTFDRIMAIRMGVRAVELLVEGKGGRCVGLRKNAIVDYDIVEALSKERHVDPDIARLADILMYNSKEL